MDGWKTVAQCATEMQVSSATVVKWIESGHLVAFVSPGVDLTRRRPGPKGYRIAPAAWDQFVAARQYTGAPGAEVRTPAARPVAGVATGTDGVRRRRKRLV